MLAVCKTGSQPPMDNHTGDPVRTDPDAALEGLLPEEDLSQLLAVESRNLGR